MTTPSEPPADVDVVIIGCGPVGALTANLLGVRGVSTLVVERSALPHGQPRAFSCDDEALRVYQQAGLLGQVGPYMHRPVLANYVNRAGRIFARVRLSEVDFGFGHPPLNFFDQPRLEAALRTGLDRFGHVTLRLGTELVSLAQDAHGVDVTLRDVATGQSRLVRAGYVLGCDGARSTTRAEAGIALSGRSYGEPWLAISGDVPPDAVRVPHTTFVCDWRRPAFVSPGTGGSYRLEFMLRPGETAAEMTRPEVVAELAAPYVDPARFTVTRAVGYTFHDLVAARWREGRVFLLGDAAHQMPPFLGQGLVSGLRDAANLTWKLALVLAGRAGEELLETYEAERRPHTVAMARMSVNLGRVFLARSRAGAWARDTLLTAAQLVPRVRRAVEHFEFKPVPAYERGLMRGGRRKGPVGCLFPQPTVTVPGSSAPVPLDEVLGDGFAVVGLAAAVAALGEAGSPSGEPGGATPPLRRVAVYPAGGTIPPSRGTDDGSRVDVVDTGGVLAGWLREHGADLVVLRPDRFVYAVAPAAAAHDVLRELTASLAAPRPSHTARP
ncbi:bifunctional 3-(3-hydroxy-phenyl)propionate/3-hydroxycinnamic acid hydroxylase [Catellatospora bangladeshensis]|uniref:3-(3-hydroxy-phenyl)propionate/3-hydroxycinnamic acid hydroxylase n=2 Tax=Catellatospora bangladeshensis TaxID=310355 RepID=A0A8J3JP48_9ACTN|nr:bifunctional 3-(3-hydroxy-phenyl)propionate/3-hydroxycinnamic acid hydroxylase [Catellatospora bangladeshensis]GIF82278.1 3-(3-hydroxy-phenyl)propionate/3-hydroxycinnamic acid hydroxylase [Catellatospora bangladeshensis]